MTSAEPAKQYTHTLRDVCRFRAASYEQWFQKKEILILLWDCLH